MKSDVLTQSIFGRVDTQLYNILRYMERRNGKDYSALVVDCVDGHLLCCIARHIKNVVGYETDPVYVNGGHKVIPVIHPITKKIVKVDRTIYGVNDRIKMEFLENAKVHNENFYLSNDNKTYDLVIANRSFERTSNNNIPIDKKMKKLMKTVNKGGYLAINYIVAKEDDDYINYPKNSFARENEIESLIDLNEWTIAKRSLRNNLFERAHVGNLEDHYVRVGYMLLKKEKTKVVKERKKYNKDFVVNIR